MKTRLKDSARFGLLLGLLLLGGVVINVWEWAGEAKVARRALAEMPTQVGSWRQTGLDQRFDAETESVLRADDYLARTYTGPEGRSASFYVGYYATQRTGATYHSPLNCLPGSGWEMNEGAPVTITPADGSPLSKPTAISFGTERQTDARLLVSGTRAQDLERVLGQGLHGAR